MINGGLFSFRDFRLMNPIQQYSQIEVATRYSAYVVESDHVVVFYNTEHPLLLKNMEAVKLVKNIQSPAQQSCSIEEALIPTLAELLMEGIIVYRPSVVQ